MPLSCYDFSLICPNYFLVCFSICRGGGGGAIAQSVERATPGEEVPGSIPAAARSLMVGSVSV